VPELKDHRRMETSARQTGAISLHDVSEQDPGFSHVHQGYFPRSIRANSQVTLVNTIINYGFDLLVRGGTLGAPPKLSKPSAAGMKAVLSFLTVGSGRCCSPRHRCQTRIVNPRFLS